MSIVWIAARSVVAVRAAKVTERSGTVIGRPSTTITSSSKSQSSERSTPSRGRAVPVSPSATGTGRREPSGARPSNQRGASQQIPAHPVAALPGGQDPTASTIRCCTTVLSTVDGT